jgi:hypothetical protein
LPSWRTIAPPTYPSFWYALYILNARDRAARNTNGMSENTIAVLLAGFVLVCVVVIVTNEPPCWVVVVVVVVGAGV